VGFENVAKYVTLELAYIVIVERYVTYIVIGERYIRKVDHREESSHFVTDRNTGRIVIQDAA
jgi:hypothetical protein